MKNLLNLFTEITENESIELKSFYNVTLGNRDEIVFQCNITEDNVKNVRNLLNILESRNDYNNTVTCITEYGNIKTVVELKDTETSLLTRIVINIY